MRYNLCSILLLLTFSYQLKSQCFEDRHNTTQAASWISCDQSINPNRDRPESHWIEYDLGEMRKLGKVQFWNLNHPDYINAGAKRIMIDYSSDGNLWEEWGEFNFDAATGSSYYEGGDGPDLDGLICQYLLITVLENHGHSCAGFSEIKIDVLELSNTDDLTVGLDRFSLQPNPALDYTNLVIESPVSERAVISVLSMEGKQLITQNFNLTTGEQTIKLSLPDLVSGQYLVNLKSASIDQTQELNVTSIH